MKKKIVGIFVMTLLIASIFGSASGIKTENIEKRKLIEDIRVPEEIPVEATKGVCRVYKLSDNKLPESVSGIDLIQIDAFMSTQPNDPNGDHRNDNPSVGTDVYLHSIFKVIGGTTPECTCMVGVDLDNDGVIEGGEGEPYCYIRDSFPPNEPGYVYYFYCTPWEVIKGPERKNTLGGIADAQKEVNEDDETNNVVTHTWTPENGEVTIEITRPKKGDLCIYGICRPVSILQALGLTVLIEGFCPDAKTTGTGNVYFVYFHVKSQVDEDEQWDYTPQGDKWECCFKGDLSTGFIFSAYTLEAFACDSTGKILAYDSLSPIIYINL